MNHSSHTQTALLTLVEALKDDPFYQALTDDFATPEQRSNVLKRYFEYSMAEAARIGQVMILPDEPQGAALWLLPVSASVQVEAAEAKHAFLKDLVGPRGYEHYTRIIAFMDQHADTLVAETAWYLSIVGVSPHVQGRGLGQRLLVPTLEAADAAQVMCYLETFNPRTLPFYERMGFQAIQTHFEPVTARDYWLMTRQPRTSREA